MSVNQINFLTVWQRKLLMFYSQKHHVVRHNHLTHIICLLCKLFVCAILWKNVHGYSRLSQKATTDQLISHTSQRGLWLWLWWWLLMMMTQFEDSVIASNDEPAVFLIVKVCTVMDQLLWVQWTTYIEEHCKKNWILWELSFHHYHLHLPHDQMQVRAGTRRVITINRKLYLEEGRAVQIISSVHPRPFSARWILRPNCAPITHCPNCRFRSAQPLLEPFNAHYKIGVAQDMTKTNLRTGAYKW